MVSSTLRMDLPELLDVLARLKREFGDDPQYQELRRELPADWPM